MNDGFIIIKAAHKKEGKTSRRFTILKVKFQADPNRPYVVFESCTLHKVLKRATVFDAFDKAKSALEIFKAVDDRGTDDHERFKIVGVEAFKTAFKKELLVSN